MAAVTVNPESVILSPTSAALANAPARNANEEIAAGQVVCVDPASGELVLAKAIASPTYVKTIEGVALNGGSEGQTIRYAKSGIVTLSNIACLTAGVVYCLSPSSDGAIVPISDITTGNLVQILGYAVNTTDLQLAIANTNVVRG